jgi:hypothetical protein
MAGVPSFGQPNYLLCLPWAVALLVGVNGGSAEMLPGQKLCAQRDLEVAILIEDHGAANESRRSDWRRHFLRNWMRGLPAPKATCLRAWRFTMKSLAPSPQRK